MDHEYNCPSRTTDVGLPPEPPPLGTRLKESLVLLRRLVGEADFVLRGGDDSHDRCIECGLAGVGMLRDVLREARELLTREFDTHRP